MRPPYQQPLTQRYLRFFQRNELKKHVCKRVIETIIAFISIFVSLQLIGKFGVVSQFFEAHFWQVVQLMLVYIFAYAVCSIVAEFLKAFFKGFFASEEESPTTQLKNQGTQTVL